MYRIHQFEKQEMIVVCKPEDSKAWYEKLWRYQRGAVPLHGYPRAAAGVLLRRSGRPEGASPATSRPGPPVSRSTSRCAPAPTWATPRPAACSIRYKDENGKMQLCHTLNNTCVAPPRMLIAFLENNLQADGTVKIPEVLRPYMGGTKVLVPTKK